MRTLFFALLVLLTGTSASSMTAETQLRLFANCAGRLTAELEHAWLLDTGSASMIENQRAQVVDLLSAVIPPDRGWEVLNWRIDARAAQRALLQRATFGKDTHDAQWARDAAALYLNDCTGLLLS